MQGTTRLRAELEHSLVRDLNDPNRRVKKIGFMDWADMDVEQLVEEKKRDKERNVLDSLPKHMRVPNKYAVAFWPALLLGILATLHALVLLMQHWSTAFNIWINYVEVSADDAVEMIPPAMLEVDVDPNHQASKIKNEDGLLVPDHEITSVPPYLPTHARITPAKEGSRDVLVPIEYYPVLGMTFEYHRRRFVYDANTATWGKIRCRTDLRLPFLASYKGLASQHQVLTAQINYGPNVFRVRQPVFLDLYKKQLLNPFSVFQVFCVLLWAIDDYLIYSFFSLFMVLVFEATVVFQRLKSMQALRGMGNPTRIVHVYRGKAWVPVDSTELLPGDVVSLVRIQPRLHKGTSGSGTTNGAAAAAAAASSGDKADTKAKPPVVGRRIEDEGGDVVPADLLLLRGSTVVNEASLTGESVPQMKEGVVLDEADQDSAAMMLDMKATHKSNVVYAGTRMLQCKGAAEDSSSSSSAAAAAVPFGHIPAPPDRGCVCFVLRTGFASAQGKLVRMIEGAQEKVKGHEKETGLLLLLLCVFAVISSGYVLYHGMLNENRSKYELLLHCILIVTSVIRPELPMQMAMAVNNSLMTLMRMNVFCTEPYRVPLAGKLDACLYDKTGTLTTDELVAVGVCSGNSLTRAKPDESEPDFLTPFQRMPGEPALVLAGCHSLVEVDGVTTGDPLESAALSCMRWHVDADGKVGPAPAKGSKPAGTNLVVDQATISELEILTRHHFSSKLQRMSCVIRTSGGRHYSVAKGSPEAIRRLLKNVPDGYDDKSQYLSKQGYRVIALACKHLDSVPEVDSCKDQRASCEADLCFAGFIAFTCKVRKDTARVLKRLREGGMSIAMVTGDALLTAIHVAKEVCIFDPIGGYQEEDEIVEANPEIRALLEEKLRAKGGKSSKSGGYSFQPILYLETDQSGSLYWKSYDDGSKAAPYGAKAVPELARRYELATTGRCLALAYEADDDTKTILQHIKVFARMTPDAKEKVIECLQGCGLLTMMTGDGANDVGALKQADVGVALLSGFGNVNVDSNADEKKEEAESAPQTAIITQRELNELKAMPVSLLKFKIRSVGVDPNKYPQLKEKDDLVRLYVAKRREMVVKQHDKKLSLDRMNMTPGELQAERKREMKKMQEEMQLKVAQRTAELEAKGVSFAAFKALKEVMAEQANENKKKAALASGVEGSAAAFAAQLEGMDAGDMPMVKLGDASVAAPFTSKMPSIRSCVDIVRQGRCTLVSSIQMVSACCNCLPASSVASNRCLFQYQIMALQCLISSYSLSALYLEGVKYGDSQMTALGILGSISFMSVSRSKPLEKLSVVRPLTSIFHPALFLSLLSQFTIHLVTMILAVQAAKRHLPPDFEVDLDGTFKPGIMNTVVFLVSGVQQVTVFVVNLQGRPFMTGLSENRPLLWSLAATFVLTFMFASETVPGLNRYFQLVAFPNDSFRDFILLILGADVVLTFAIDRLMQFIFCRDILKASIEGTTIYDVFGLVRTFVVIAVLMHVFMGNSETWDHLLEMELNMTANLTSTSESIVETAAECVGELCKAAADAFQPFTTEF
jgi:manganese-transporting P-type ATPase